MEFLVISLNQRQAKQELILQTGAWIMYGRCLMLLQKSSLYQVIATKESTNLNGERWSTGCKRK
jgi:hypothetical protein